jgi:large subunit ribosomal protein L22
MEITEESTPQTKKLYRGKLRFVRTSSDKAGQVLELIRGKTFYQAKYILTYTPKKASRLILKLLESIAANARNTAVEERPDLDDLYIYTATANQGPSYPPRISPRAYGRATRIKKRTSHISLTLAEHAEAAEERAARHAKKTRKKPVAKKTEKKPVKKPVKKTVKKTVKK